MEIKFKHHRKLPNSDDFAETPLCLPFQVAGFCKNGMNCTENHRSRKAMLIIGDAEMKRKIKLIDRVVDSTSSS